MIFVKKTTESHTKWNLLVIFGKMRVIKIKIEVSDEIYKILNSILENGFSINNWQSIDINQVIDHLLFIAYAHDKFKEKTENEYFELIYKKRYQKK